MDRTDSASNTEKKGLLPIHFIILEAVIFGVFLFFEICPGKMTYMLYIYGLPLAIAATIVLDKGLRNRVAESFVSADFLILAGAIAFWFFIYSFYGFGRWQVLISLYAPVILEEVNFRFVLLEYLGRKIGMEKAVLTQGLLFGLWYLYYELVYQGTFPNLFLTITFVISMITIGIIYGAIYYIRKNVYIPMALHLTLLLMVLPIMPWWVDLLSYLMGPT